MNYCDDIQPLIDSGELQRIACIGCGHPLYLPADFPIPRDGMLCGNACAPRLPGIYLCYPPPTGERHDSCSNP